MIDLSNNGGGFNEWNYLNPKSKNIEKKMGYAVKYKPLNIFVGTAIYEQDIIMHIKSYSSQLLNKFKNTHNGYIFAYDDKGNTISHIKKDLIGINRWNLKKDGKYVLQEIIKKGQDEGGGFIEYTATVNPIINKQANKISFVNEFKQLKWIIGTGFYLDNLYSDIKINQEKLRVEFDRELKDIII
jgi:signal transduction histidine kinase